MSVLMTLRVAGDPEKLEQLAGERPDMISTIMERARSHGLISHRFYGGEGQILVVDEWPSDADFKAFFDSSPEIPQLMQEVATGQPEITFWRQLETGDAV
jgi:hypothetical protein